MSEIKHFSQPSFYLREIRYHQNFKDTTFDCLLCGRCNTFCPVGIESTNIRLENRLNNPLAWNQNYSYFPKPVKNRKKVEVIYFAGCMTHLTPSIIHAIKKILDQSGYTWKMIDENGTICCGRPMLLSGNKDAAIDLIRKNKEVIKSFQAKVFVTTCPICYRMFKTEYNLAIDVLHHTEFIWNLLINRKLNLVRSNNTVVYHDPCELGRGMGIYNQSRQIIQQIAILLNTTYLYEKSLCCGGSIAHSSLSFDDRKLLTETALQKLKIRDFDTLITACPLCKKTFDITQQVVVKDIAEFVKEHLVSESSPAHVNYENEMADIN